MPDVPADTLALQWFSEFIRWTVVDEPYTLPRLLSDTGRELFRRHTATLPRPTDEAGIRRMTANLWNGETGWAMRWITSRLLEQPRGAEPLRVVDASCGIGTDAMLFGRLGAEVSAMDIRPDHLNVARWRSAHMTWLHNDHGPVTFRRAALSHGFSDSCDLVWLREGLSRVDPPGYFLSVVREHLRPGGVLVIGDSCTPAAGTNERGRTELSPLHETFTSSDGRSFGHAFRPALTADQIDGLLGRHGFRIVQHETVHERRSIPESVLRHCPAPLVRLLHLTGAPAHHRCVIASPA